MTAVHSGLVAFSFLFNVFAQGQDAISDIQVTPGSESGPCEASQIEEYSTEWHLAGIFIVMLSSGTGIFITLSLGARARKPFIAGVLQILKMFGIGVIAATGWCHLLPDAFESFTSKCLPEGWADYGAPFVGVFALFSSFIVQLIEMSAGGHSHGVPHSPSESHVPHINFSGAVSDVFLRHESLLSETVHREKSSRLAVMILEAGVLFHSLIIGLSLGVTGDSDTFKVLLIAVSFHQFFEGLALGALIAKMNYSVFYKFFVMGLLYPLTTPIGMTIGILVHQYFNQNVQIAILAEGILNSLSAGILMYTTYAELLSNEVTNNEMFRSYTRTYKFYNMMALYSGAAAMALLAKWS